MQQPDETPAQPEARHSETYPERAPDPAPRARSREAFAGECGDPIWECEAADGEMREDPAYDPHAAEPQQRTPPGDGQGWRIIDLVERRERRE